MAATGDFSFFNPTGRADQVDISLLQTLNPANSLYGSLAYRTPVYDAQTFVGGSLSRNAYDIGGDLEDEEISGSSDVVEAYVQRRFVRSRQRNLDGRVSLAWKRATTEQRGIEFSDDTHLLAAVQLNYDGLSASGIDVAQGLVSLGRWDDPERNLNRRQGGSGDFAEGTFSKLEAGYTRMQSFAALPNHSLLLRVAGQASGDMLPSLEQFSLGGPDSVRGYSRAEFLRDRGYFLSAEWIARAPGFADKPAFRNLLWGQVFQVSVFADYGRGWLNDPPQDDAGGVELGGAGFALRFEEPGRWLGRVQVAWPLTSHEPENEREPQLWLDLNYRF